MTGRIHFMSKTQLQQLRTMAENAGDLPPTARTRLLDLVAQAEQAPATPNAAVVTLHSVVTEFEAAHPEATAFLNRVATSLGNMGL
jgi:hypothetical protein